MSDKLDEKINECQESLKTSMDNSIKESVDKIELAMKCLEDRIDIKITKQKEEFNVEILEVEDRMIKRTMEETDWVKEYVDNSMTQRVEIIKSGISETNRRYENKFKEIAEADIQCKYI